ncbi:MAG: SDR family NAD(P)-dependent oxidoreductase [Bacillota bacterium]
MKKTGGKEERVVQGEFSGKVVMITGAARGIGKASAELFAANGAALALGDVREQQVREVAEECARRFGVGTLAVYLDVCQAESIKNFVKRTMEEFGRIDALVNSAGVCEICPIEDIREAAWDRVMEINVKGLFMVSQAVLPIMKSQRSGCIVNLGSLAGLVGVCSWVLTTLLPKEL